jgi:N6-L-threonylcarbamoyladenine synthase
MTILALETSCDDTCAAVIGEDGSIRSNVISSQRAHDRFGGVVPEIASRHHLELVNLVVEEALADAGVALEQIDRIAVTQGPGLIGALLVGLSTAKSLAAARELPLVPIDHLQGHVAANFLVPDDGGEPFEPPFVCLIASGGHTLLARVEDHQSFATLGRTLDDAAGEAFDKGARMLGLGYPGGPALERLAAKGDPEAFEFPASGSRTKGGRGATRPFARGLDFSFAGLKTSLLYRLRDLEGAGELDGAKDRGKDGAKGGGKDGAEDGVLDGAKDGAKDGALAADLAASFQAAIVEHLVVRAQEALERTGLDRLAVGGGVAANGALRQRLGEIGANLHVPAKALCTDNAAMIGAAARFASGIAYPDYLGIDAYATGERPF